MPLHLLVLVPKTSGYRGGSASHCAPPLAFTAEAGYGGTFFPARLLCWQRTQKDPAHQVREVFENRGFTPLKRGFSSARRAEPQRTHGTPKARTARKPPDTEPVLRRAPRNAADEVAPHSNAGSRPQGARSRSVRLVRKASRNAADEVPHHPKRLRRLPSGRR